MDMDMGMDKGVERDTGETAGTDRMADAGGVRRAQAARRRERLLEAGLALFSERGYRGASVRDLTRAAGVTEAVLYHYFANKAGLWTAVLAAYAPFGQVGELLEASRGLPADEALSRIGHRLLALLEERRQLVLTMLGEAAAEPDVAATLERFLGDVTSALAAFLAERQAAGEIDPGLDPAAAARAFQGALLVQFLAGRPDDDRMVDRVVAALWTGLRAQPPA